MKCKECDCDTVQIRSNVFQCGQCCEVYIKNKYWGFGYGYGIVGYCFTCIHCGEDTLFVNEEEDEQYCKHCDQINEMIPME